MIQRLQEEAISEINPASARVRRLEVLCRTLGLFDDKRGVEVKHRFPEEIMAALREELESLVGEGLLP